MKKLTATNASRHFAEVLDAVEHEHETFVVTRGGRAVATIGPATGGSGRALKSVLRQHRPDRQWSADLHSIRTTLIVEQRPWHG